MGISQTSSSTGTTSPSRRSSIPVPKRKSSLHLYISNSIVGPSNSSSPSSASSTHGEDHVNEFGGSRADSPSPHSASSSRSATAMSMHNSLYVPRSSAATAATSAAAEINTNEYLQLRENHNRLINKCEEITKRNQNLEGTNQMLKKSIVALQTEIATLRKERTDKNRKLKKKLSEIVPSGEGISSEDEASEKSSKSDNNSSTVDQPQHSQGPKPREGEMDVALNELEKLKSYVNNVELQLYEANEKISELQESKQQSEETIIKLRAEKDEFSKIARLMSANMQESIDASQR
ncbi:hypothetical protein RP20_CCG004292 [Aedes albopictus]|nr:hypothetical protein RP20_CCG004292 [Aedes albopictus]